jgi:hypothetical protein
MEKRQCGRHFPKATCLDLQMGRGIEKSWLQFGYTEKGGIEN